MNKFFTQIHDNLIYLMIEIEMILRGVLIKSVWDLVNMDTKKYVKHVGILLKYLTKILFLNYIKAVLKINQ